MTYTTQTAIGSVDMLFCINPIPTATCVAPPGLDVSQAVLSAQTGETGYSVTTQTSNHLVLSRTAAIVGNTPSTYTFENVTNPTSMPTSFAIRLADYASSNATGPVLDLGSVVSQVTSGILLQTQVPPMLIFCVGQQVSDDCASADGSYTNMGTLSSDKTLIAHSQMAVGTNASGGYAITINGTSMEAGSNVITPLATPTVSAPGNSQFGVNLRANTSPVVGGDPDGASSNATPMNNYNTPNLFMFKDGDIVATASNVSLVRRFTVSYMVNVPPDLRAGVYTTTLTYICTGRF